MYAVVCVLQIATTSTSRRATSFNDLTGQGTHLIEKNIGTCFDLERADVYHKLAASYGDIVGQLV